MLVEVLALSVIGRLLVKLDARGALQFRGTWLVIEHAGAWSDLTAACRAIVSDESYATSVFLSGFTFRRDVLLFVASLLDGCSHFLKLDIFAPMTLLAILRALT